MNKNNITTDVIAKNKNSILYSLITLNEQSTKKPPLHPSKPTLVAKKKKSKHKKKMAASTQSLLTKNPITFTEEEAMLSSRWKKYIYKIHHLVIDEIPNMCLISKTNNKYEYESSCGSRKVKFICRFEGIPQRQYCTGVIIDNDTPIYHKTKKTPKKLYKSLYNYIGKYYVEYLLDQYKYSGYGLKPMPTLKLDDKGVSTDGLAPTLVTTGTSPMLTSTTSSTSSSSPTSSSSSSPTSSPSSSPTQGEKQDKPEEGNAYKSPSYGGGTVEYDFYNDDAMYDESMWADH